MRWGWAPPSSLKKFMSSVSASACAAISSAVDASSSDVPALRPVTSSTAFMAWLIWATPAACCWLAAATSWTRSAVFWIDGTSSSRSTRDRLATATLVPASPPISPAAFCARSASFRTSAATTAKPRPWSPARAASMAAFRARRLVW